MKRCIIRSLFIGLLLLCLGWWALSHRHVVDVHYQGRNLWGMLSYRGTIRLQWFDASWKPLTKKWCVQAPPSNAAFDATYLAAERSQTYDLVFAVTN